MSVAVCRELLSDLLGHDWIPINREGCRSLLTAGLATIPSVTEVSRTSLLCGRLAQGASADERSGFAEHGTLGAHSKDGYPPKVFHKSALRGEDDSILAGEVREEIASPNRRIVGIVINAIDDQLLKGEQLDTRWSRDAIPVLPAILHEAKLARRMVVLTSDHGHVLDSNTTCKPSEGGERWRMAVGAPGEGEIAVKGTRVVIPDSKTLIAPWSENIRYGIKKNGYHGGVTPQEMVTPIAVLNPSENFPEGWEEVPVDVPAWWEESTSVPAVAVAVPPRPKAPKPTKSPRSQQTKLLFDVEGQSGPVEDSPMAPATESRLDRSALRLCDIPATDEARRAIRSVGNPVPCRAERSGSAWRENDVGGALSLGELPRDAATRTPGRDAACSEHRGICRLDAGRRLRHGGSESRTSEASIRLEVSFRVEHQPPKTRPDHRRSAPGNRPAE